MRSPALAVALLFLVRSAPALAYDSVCRVERDNSCDEGCGTAYRDCDGFEAAQTPWSETSEHASLWKRARVLAGLPALVDEPFSVHTASMDGSFAPARFDRAELLLSRMISIPAFAQLPDFSYALWDWTSGNETCPPNDTDFAALPCHAFEHHMGWLNSNHFLPQAERSYGHFHALAVARATECRAFRDRIRDRQGDEFAPELAAILRACDRESLLIEAIAQHFMQDAWSSGHMWERWGSPDLADFLGPAQGLPIDQHASAVAMTSGLIHGAKAVLGTDDPLCAPRDSVRWIAGDGGDPRPGAGDLFLASVLEDSEFSQQRERLDACTAGSLREVYAASAQSLGDLAGGAVSSSDRRTCFGQRATNDAMFHAAGLHVGPFFFPLSGTTASTLLWFAGAVQPVLSKRLQADLWSLGTRLAVYASRRPRGVEMATFELGTLLGMKRNGAYADKPPPYLDPPLPWLPAPAPARASASDAGNIIARTFVDAHAGDWCDTWVEGGGELDLETLRARAQDRELDPAVRDVACEICTQFASRALRVGDPMDRAPSPAREPACAFLAADPQRVQYVYVPEPKSGDVDRHELARAWCCEQPMLQLKILPGPGSPATRRVTILVSDALGAPVANTMVSLTTDRGVLRPTTGTTDANGLVEATLTLQAVAMDTRVSVEATANTPDGHSLTASETTTAYAPRRQSLHVAGSAVSDFDSSKHLDVTVDFDFSLDFGTPPSVEVHAGRITQSDIRLNGAAKSCVFAVGDLTVAGLSVVDDEVEVILGGVVRVGNGVGAYCTDVSRIPSCCGDECCPVAGCCDEYESYWVLLRGVPEFSSDGVIIGASFMSAQMPGYGFGITGSVTLAL